MQCHSATKLFNENVNKKRIRERTGHTSNALFTHEKPSTEKEEILGPVEQKNNKKEVYRSN